TLKNWNCGFPLCFAGALYQLYVPNTPLKTSLETIRPMILELCGAEADRLAQLFATADIAKLVNEGVGTNKYDGTEITLQENDRQFAKLFQTASLVEKTESSPPPIHTKSSGFSSDG
ncbi:MAG TPA: hypothetical protein VGM92_02850, partial [Candidatus Kapabacteria bacterium]